LARRKSAMNKARAWMARLAGMFGRARRDRDLAAELESHLALHIDDNLRAGMTAEEARRRAMIRLGGLEQAKELYRERRGIPLLESLWQDSRYGLRGLCKSPGFTAVAVLTLAFGIGASTAVFSLVNTVLLKPMPFPHAERIVFPWRLLPPQFNLGFKEGPWGRVEFLFLSRTSRTFEYLGAFQSDSFNLTGSGHPVHVDGLRASAGFFPALGVAPELGRTFTDAEDHPGHAHEVILSDALWRERFGADPGILGRVLDLNGAPYTVIGVMPPGFEFPRANEMPPSFTFAPGVQLWIPLGLNRGPILPAEPDELAVVGRLKPGVTLSQASAETDTLGQRFAAKQKFPTRFFHYELTPLERQVTGDARRPLLMLLGAVGVVLLISCSNVASLLLARFLGRRRELTLRAALGAGNGRLIRQLLTESLMLSVAGGLAGILLAAWGVHLVRIFGPPNIPRLGQANLDWRVVVFALGVTLLTGILLGLVPAIDATRENLVEMLQSDSQRSGSSVAGRRARNSLLVSQIALALVLVISAGLFIRTFHQLLAVNPGFHPAHVLTFELSLPTAKYPDQAHIVRLYHEALGRLRALPGVESAGVAEVVPLGGATESTNIRIPGRPEANSLDIPVSNYTVVSPGYFAAVGTPILRGRPFLESDTANSTPVTVISESMARKFWPGENPLGKQVGPRSHLYPQATIVGIAADVKRLSLRDNPPPEMYVPYTQKVWPSLQTMDIVLRTTQNPASISASARKAIQSVDPDLPLANVKPLEKVVAESMTRTRFSVLLLAAFGALALVLATVGMYGVISYNVAHRTREIGIRMTFGAQRRDILQLVLRQGAGLAVLGIAIGLAVAFGITRWTGNLLYGVRPTDPLTFVVVSLLLLGVALLACYIPARRAMRVDPVTALRQE
jgi:predicted permease